MQTFLKLVTRSLILAAIFAAVPACQPHFEMKTARDFLVLEGSYPYDFRATTPEGVVIAVREFDNDEERGELEFWSKAIENELRLDQGYALIDKSPVETKQGLRGVQMRFGLDRAEEAHLYLVTVFVTYRKPFLKGQKSRVFVVESGGSEELVRHHQNQLDWSLDNFVAH